MLWKTPRFELDLGAHACAMGIVNVTPDSFSDGGNFFSVDRAIDHALRLLAEGAAIIDIGGESTRPGAVPVGAVEEARRVLPVIEGLLKSAPHALISIDTSKAGVARMAMEHGASIINDVTALTGDPGMLAVAAEHRAGVVLMHMQGTPATMQLAPHYEDPVAEVRGYLARRYEETVRAGIAPESVALDVGIGFGKRFEDNLALLRHFESMTVGGRPGVVGISRKGFLGKIAGVPAVEARLWPALAFTALLRQRGARIFRTHDVAPTVTAIRAAEALLAP